MCLMIVFDVCDVFDVFHDILFDVFDVFDVFDDILFDVFDDCV